jgi:hypothetical protein
MQIQPPNGGSSSYGNQNWQPDGYDKGWIVPGQAPDLSLWNNFIHDQLQNIPSNFAEYTSWVQTHHAVIADLVDAASFLINTGQEPPANVLILEQIKNAGQNLETSNPVMGDYNNLIAGIQDLMPEPADYETYLKSLASLFPSGYQPANWQAWVQANPGLLNSIANVAKALSAEGNTDADWDQIALMAGNIQQSGGGSASELSGIADMLKSIGTTPSDNQNDTYTYLYNLYSQIPTNLRTPQQIEAWMQDPNNRQLVANIVNTANYMIAKWGPDRTGFLRDIMGTAELLLSQNPSSGQELSMLSEELQSLQIYIQ